MRARAIRLFWVGKDWGILRRLDRQGIIGIGMMIRSALALSSLGDQINDRGNRIGAVNQQYSTPVPLPVSHVEHRMNYCSTGLSLA